MTFVFKSYGSGLFGDSEEAGSGTADEVGEASGGAVRADFVDIRGSVFVIRVDLRLFVDVARAWGFFSNRDGIDFFSIGAELGPKVLESGVTEEFAVSSGGVDCPKLSRSGALVARSFPAEHRFVREDHPLSVGGHDRISEAEVRDEDFAEAEVFDIKGVDSGDAFLV